MGEFSVRGLVIFLILQKEMSEVLAFFFRSLQILRLILPESLLLGISSLFTGEKRWCFPNSVFYVPCFTLGPCIGDGVPPKCRLLRRLSSPSPIPLLPHPPPPPPPFPLSFGGGEGEGRGGGDGGGTIAPPPGGGWGGRSPPPLRILMAFLRRAG